MILKNGGNRFCSSTKRVEVICLVPAAISAAGGAGRSDCRRYRSGLGCYHRSGTRGGSDIPHVIETLSLRVTWFCINGIVVKRSSLVSCLFDTIISGYGGKVRWIQNRRSCYRIGIERRP